jgi:asparagine synthase (glutamine-hydrolysing)
MCGIVTIFSYHNAAPAVDRGELLRVRDRMLLRGPDGAGEWYSDDKRVAMGHRRLAIIDLSENGAQPMRNRDNSLVITFNGEIYNYRELRTELEKKGYDFYSTSDTEVLLNLYAEKGHSMVHDLRGMYAFAIWDEQKKGLFLARDPFGIKPLYYADDGRTFRAASQVKALLSGGAIDTASEPAGHVGFFLWGHVPEPYTMYKSIRSLPAGTSMWVDTNGAKGPRTFCSISEEIEKVSAAPPVITREEMQSRLRDMLLDSVRHHLISDVPVGVFLSSGLDSTTLAALVAEVGGNLNTITLGFDEYRGTMHDETPLAELTAKQYGAKHQTIWVKRADFIAERQKLMASMDQPSVDGVNTYFVSLAAAKAGMKVAVSGLGGDELFGSYPSFGQLPRMVSVFKPFNKIPAIGKTFRYLSSPFLKKRISPKYAGLFEYAGSWGGAYMLWRGMYMPWEQSKMLDEDMLKEGWRELQSLIRLENTIRNIDNDYLRVSALEMSWYMRNQLLRDTDWASMAHSLEVRVPFLDLEFLRSLIPLLCSNNKPDKRDLASTPLKPITAAVLARRKTGFSVPIHEWLIEDKGRRKIERGLRGWAKVVAQSFKGEKKRILALISDAFGGHGGIALYNRDLLTALCRYPGNIEVTAIPRIMPLPSEQLPDNLTYVTTGINGKLAYIKTVFLNLRKHQHYDLIICGHINLLPVAMLIRAWLKVPVLLEIYGIDAWQKTGSKLVNYLAPKVDVFISISEITKKRFLEWAKIPESRGYIVPNAIHLDKFLPGPKNPALLDRYKLRGKKILMTLGRLVSHERYKGFDEVMEALPTLEKEFPDIAYLIVGDGSDRSRLEAKARTLEIADKVVFTGFIAEEEKADYYRLADVYVMPGKGEGFGFVFLEAMACGVPVIASKLDGSREALRYGKLGLLVDPRNPDDIRASIVQMLKNPKYPDPDELAYFSFENFVQRSSKIWDSVA